MNFNFNILIIIFYVILSLLLFCVIAYLLLPGIFKKFVSPKFNASYIFKSKDFKEKGKIEQIPEQNNFPHVDIDRNFGVYQIFFGPKRKLIHGLIKLRHNNKEYINYEPSEEQKILELLMIREESGTDKLGNYNSFQLEFRLEDEEKYINASFRQYINENFIIFELSIPHGLEETSSGKYSIPITSFPSFINNSINAKIFTYRNAIFCPPSRVINATSAPVILYDYQLNSLAISPLDGFLHTIISEDKDGRISCGIQGEIEQLPKEFSQKYIIIFGKGINSLLEQLGDILLKYHDSKRKSLYADVLTSYLGFWTDNGGYYYYKTEKGLNYEDTLLAIKEYFEEKGIPIGYYNFDSWWYLKYTNKLFATLFRPLIRLLGGGLYGNILRWEADPKNFTTDLKTFHRERFKKPITAHNRRWDSRSPYLNEFPFETYENHAVPLKREFWDWLMNHAEESGIVVYEQDWLKNQITSMPILREDYNAQESWLFNMANSAKEHGLDVFYCMQTPGILLYSIKHPNITISRCSGDYNHRWPLTYRFIHSTQTNILFHALGINSHPDVFRSRSMENVRFRPFGEKYPDFNCLYQILNAGIVAPGDKKENLNWSLLRKTCREDGLLLKPDKPLTANDMMFKKHRKYYICDTYTKINGLTWRYLLISNIWPKSVKEMFFMLQDLGYNDQKYILYDYFKGEIQRIKSTDKIEIGKLKKYDYKYYILCPITNAEMALIGCIDKFITCSRKMFLEVVSKIDSLNIKVQSIKGVENKILIYSKTKPSSIQIDGEPIEIWDFSRRLISLNVKFEKYELKNIIIQI